jgi:hypothetical protein
LLLLSLLIVHPCLFLSVYGRKWLSVMSGRRHEAGPIDPLRAKALHYDVRESDRPLSC